jgi:hypothetical protein
VEWQNYSFLEHQQQGRAAFGFMSQLLASPDRIGLNGLAAGASRVVWLLAARATKNALFPAKVLRAHTLLFWPAGRAAGQRRQTVSARDWRVRVGVRAAIGRNCARLLLELLHHIVHVDRLDAVRICEPVRHGCVVVCRIFMDSVTAVQDRSSSVRAWQAQFLPSLACAAALINFNDVRPGLGDKLVRIFVCAKDPISTRASHAVCNEAIGARRKCSRDLQATGLALGKPAHHLAADGLEHGEDGLVSSVQDPGVK